MKRLIFSKGNCPRGFNGDICIYDCGNLEVDDNICTNLNCSSNRVKGLCPQKCFCPQNEFKFKPCKDNGDFCITQFGGVESCKGDGSELVRSMCPKMCRLCQTASRKRKFEKLSVF